MNRLYTWLNEHSSVKIVFLLFLLTQTVYFSMLFVTIPNVMEHSNGMKIFDMQPTGYSPDYAKRLLDTLEQEGRRAYLLRQLPLDMVYPLFFAVTYSLLLTLVFKRGFEPGSKMHMLCVVPILAGLLDYAENVGISMMLSEYPDFSTILVQLTNFFSISKSILTVSFFALLFIGGVAWVKQKRKPTLPLPNPQQSP